MSASSPHGFVVVRRGYRPEQVDGKVSDLHEERVEAEERVSALTVLEKELADEAERLRTLLETLTPQTYASLGPRAQELLATVTSEGEDVQAGGESEARRLAEESETAAQELREAARTAGEEVRADAEADADRTLAASRDEAEELREAARSTAEQTRQAALDALDEMGRRCSELRADQERDHKQRTDTLDQQLADQEADNNARVAELDEQARRVLVDAQRVHTDAEEAARSVREEAESRASGILSEARARQQRIERDSDRLREKQREKAEKMREHMEHVRNSLATLVGKGADVPVGAEPGQSNGA
ncbi:hypothetical protein [Streptomyces oceani]|uniref:Cellulose-binding protein n=1 Tax=Streptomyces oceani TaxID=1075402 RepID=A0A1E7KN52_9ACTN|nr:hypothetical protein [Streptomyces oceani]OEV05338.1 hypothetical protein AN216_03280 [Streptomyces oceani]